MRLLTTMIALGFCTLLVPPLPAEQPALETDEQKTLYALGISISRSLRPFELTEKEFVHVESGFADGTLGRDSRVVLETFGPKVDAMLLVRVAAITEREKQAGQALLSKSCRDGGQGAAFPDEQADDQHRYKASAIERTRELRHPHNVARGW